MRFLRSLSYENRLLGVLFLTFGIVFFDRLALAFLFPFIAADLGLGHAQLGMLSSVLALAWAVSGAFMGAYTDRHGRRRMTLIISVLLFSCFSALSGVVTGFISLLLFRALMGLSEGAVLPLAQTLMAQASSPHRRGLNMGLLQGSSAGLLGAVIGPPLIIALAQGMGWRTAFYLTCIPGLAAAWLIRRHVRDDDRRPATEPMQSPGGQRRAHFSVLRQRNVVLCIVMGCFFMAWFTIIISFAPTYLISLHQLSPGSMSAVMSCLGGAWVLWGFAVPAISDRIGRRPALVLFSLVAASCPLVFLFVRGPWLTGALLMLTYTGVGCFTLFMATVPAETVSRASMATALGFIMGISEMVGGFVAPMAAGYAADRHGLPVVMWVAMFSALAAAGVALGLRETAPSRVARASAAMTTSKPA